MGGVVPVVNLDGIKPGDLMLDGPTLAKIFLGEIKTWNDPAIKKLNPSAKLPSQAIVVVHRSDGSGTTFIFTDYLSKVSADWKSKVGANTVGRMAGRHRRQGQRRRRQQRRADQGLDRLCRIRLCQAEQADLHQDDQQGRQDGRADRRSRSRPPPPTPTGTGTPGFGVILTDQPGAESWPIAGATFILMHKQPQDPAAAAEALKFFAWAYAKGDKMAEDLDYVPMPDNVVDRDQEGLGERRSRTRRQADVRAVELTLTHRERRRIGAFLLVHRGENTTCEAARTPLEWAPENDSHGSLAMQPAGRRTWSMWRCRAARSRPSEATSRVEGAGAAAGSATSSFRHLTRAAAHRRPAPARRRDRVADHRLAAGAARSSASTS